VRDDAGVYLGGGLAILTAVAAVAAEPGDFIVAKPATCPDPDRAHGGRR